MVDKWLTDFQLTVNAAVYIYYQAKGPVIWRGSTCVMLLMLQDGTLSLRLAMCSAPDCQCRLHQFES